MDWFPKSFSFPSPPICNEEMQLKGYNHPLLLRTVRIYYLSIFIRWTPESFTAEHSAASMWATALRKRILKGYPKSTYPGQSKPMPLMFVVMTQETTVLIYLWKRYKHSCLNDKKHSMLIYCFCLPFPWSLFPEPCVSKASKCSKIGSKSTSCTSYINLASKKEILFCMHVCQSSIIHSRQESACL